MTESIITTDLVALDVDAGPDKAAVISRLANLLAEAGRVSGTEGVVAAALSREEQSPTGLPGGLAIPHCRVAEVRTASLAFARLAPAVDFGAPDGPADLVFLIAAPEHGASDHMRLLSSLARALVRPDFVAALRSADSAADIVALVDDVVSARPASGAAAAGASAAAQHGGGTATLTAPAPTTTQTDATDTAADEVADPATAQPTGSGDAAHRPRLVAVTACPTGIAHTYMAADSLTMAGERAGVDIAVETQGSGNDTPLPQSRIDAADAVIFAVDVGVRDRERFAGKPLVSGTTNRAINNSDAMVADAIAAAGDPNATRVAGDAAATETSGAGGQGLGTQLKAALLTGVSYMIPFVAAGGLLIALGFLLGGYKLGLTPDGATDPLGYTVALHNSLWHLPSGGVLQYLGGVSFYLGKLAFFFLVPALAGYIAYAIAGRPGLAPGFTAGYVAVVIGAGFIGGLVGGLLAGVVTLYVSKIPLPKWAKGLMPVVIIPFLATLITGAIMFLFLGRPLAWITTELTNWLGSLDGTSRILLGVILGLMMCFDLGGPVNKAAYAFAVQGIATGSAADLRIMAAVMCAGMVPPLAMALATAVRPGLFNEAERESGKAAWLLGACFISEGAIPFAAADPLRVIPSMMAGGAVSGGLIMLLDVQLRAPHGGIFVFFAMNNWVWFLVALAAGTVIAAAIVVVLKEIRQRTRRSADATPTTAAVANTAVTA